MTNKPTEALQALDKLTEHLIHMTNYYEEGMVLACGFPSWIFHADETIRAALDNPMTLPDLPDGWRVFTLHNTVWKSEQWFIALTYRAHHELEHNRHINAMGDTPREAALNAIAKIKEAR
jgi:hypothetical protein